MVDRTQSIIDEAFAKFNNPTSPQVNDLLTDPNSRRALAVSVERGNDLTEQPGVGADLAGLSYEELLVQYGPEVADNQILLRNQVNANRATRDVDRTAGEVISDTAKSATASFVDGIANTSGAVVAGLDSIRNGGTFAEGAVPFVESNSEFTGFIRDQRSEALKAREALLGIEAELDNADSQAQRDREVAAGENEMFADFRQVGRDILSTIDRAQQDVGVTGDIVASGVGSLVPSAIVAASGAGIIGGGTSLVTKNQIAQRVATATGSALGAGISEAGGTYSETVNEVLQLSEEHLQNSEAYRGMIESGMTPDEARVNFAGLTAETAFIRQLPTAVAIGFLSSKFNSAPIGAFAEKGIIGGLRTIIGEGLEETLQGSTSQLNTNQLLGELDGRSLVDGVGQAAVEGAIGGIGQAGVSATPNAALGTINAAVDTVQNAVPNIQASARETYQSARDLATRPDTEGMNKAVRASAETTVAVEAAVQSGAVAPETVQNTTPAPEGFDIDASVLENVTRVTQMFASSATKATTAQVAFAADQISRLRGMLKSLPPEARASAQQVVNSPQARKVERDLKNFDQNTAPVETITPDVVSETVSVAKVNPTNVNPETVDKILKESGESISPQDTAIMKGASRIASRVNRHAESRVSISNDRNVGLTKLGKAPLKDSPKTAKDVSRSITVEGFTDATGRDLRSINDFAADIFAGVQSPDGTIINKEGQAVQVSEIMTQFGNFVKHMNNKVEALNQSYAQNNRKGNGPNVQFESLVGGTKFVPAGGPGGAKGVFYNRSNPRSAETARLTANDLQVAVDVYNDIRDTFPEQFGSLPAAEATQLSEDPSGFIDIEQLALEIDAQEQAEIASVKEQQGERRLRKDALLKPEESLIDSEDNGQPAPVVEESEATAEVSETASESENVQPVDDIIEDSLTEGTDTDVNIDQTNDMIVDDDGNPIPFYHGTTAEFTEFNDGGIFLTTRKGLAREHARRGGEGTPRLIEAHVTLGNPLTKDISDLDEDPDSYWLKNSLKIEELKQAGGYDSIFIFNDKEGMVIADRNDQVIQTNPDFDNTINKVEEEVTPPEPEVVDEGPALDEVEVVEQDFSNLHPSFAESFQTRDDDPVINNLDEYLAKVEDDPTMNQETVAFAKKMIQPIINSLNKRLNRSFGKGTLKDALKEGEVQTFRDYKVTALVDPETGRYDQNLMELAGLAFVDWLTTARATDANRFEETLESLGVNQADLTNEQFQSAMFGISPSRVKNEIAKNILRMWNMKENLDSPLGDLVGITEGLAAEMLTVLTDSKNSTLLDAIKLPTMKDGVPVETETLVVSGLVPIQNKIQDANLKGVKMTAKEYLFNEGRETYSIGEKLTVVAQSQNRSNVQLTPLQKDALKGMQDTPHFKDESRSELARTLGKEALKPLFGFRDDVDDINNEILRNSVKGKNISVEKNIDDAFRLVDQLDDRDEPVYYPVGITKVGRHQYQGVNPQSNKVLRMLVTPTWSELDLNDQTDVDAFWLGVAQASELYKVEKANHKEILAEVESKVNENFRGAIDLVKNWLQTGEIDSQAFLDNFDSAIEPQVFAAIQSVAEFEFHKERGTNEPFRTSLSFELDGLTNGAANMMVNYGQGTVTQEDFQNFNRIGLFLGKLGKTVNQYFSARNAEGQRNRDLYEATTDVSQRRMFRDIKNLEGQDKEIMLAAGRFAARFGNFEVVEGEDGDFALTRNTAKNPMTKVNYGSGVAGVAAGISDDMILEFYRKIQGIPDNVNMEEYFGYPGIDQDFKLLFGDTISGTQFDGGAFIFAPETVKDFRKKIERTIGKVLTESTKTVIGDKITELNDMLVFSTNVQSEYIQLSFQAELEALALELSKGENPRVRINKKSGKPQLADLTRRDFNSVVKKFEALSPIFVSDDQTLAIGGFQNTQSNLELSRNMDGKFSQNSQLPGPEEVGVRAIPYSVIGSGDAMMMNLIFGSQGAPTDVLGIFDGLDVPLSKIKEYAPYVNEQVAKSWDRDVLAMATQNFGGFLSQVGDSDVLTQAFQNVQDRSKKSSVTATSPAQLQEQLVERHRQNKARKAVLKRIPMSVDQMGGSDVGYSRGEGEMTLSEINYEIQKELEGRGQKVEDVNIEVQVMDTNAALKMVKLTGEDSKVVGILKETLPNTKVVIGTIDQINAFRQENFPDDGQILEGNAQYDSAHGTIYLTKADSELLLHEMVHAATYGAVLSHYEGETNPAVERLEALMNEFMSIDSVNPKVNQAQAAIAREQALPDAQSQAAAVNEFMAYGLSNQLVRNALKSKETSLLKKISDQVIQLMKRIFGGSVPTDMFNHLVFNTKVLKDAPEVSEGNGNNNDDGGGSDGELTPHAEKYTSFWIELLKEHIADYRKKTKALKKSARPLKQLNSNVEKVVDGYRQVGMLNNAEAVLNFKAIYMVMSSGMKMDPNSVIALSKMFNHIEENMTPDMFGSHSEAVQEYSAVISSFGAFKNGDISDGLSVVLALSQTSKKFRAVLDQIPDPEGNVRQDGSLVNFLENASGMVMRKVVGAIETQDKSVLDVLDGMEQTIIDLDQEREYTVMRAVTSNLDKADKYVSGIFSKTAGFMRRTEVEVRESTRSDFQKRIVAGVTLGTNLLDKNLTAATADAAKAAVHMDVPVLSLVPIRELVSEIIGTDAKNQNLVGLYDVVTSRIAGMRQAYREDLPGILNKLFKTAPTAEQWQSMHTVLGKTDFTRFMSRDLSKSMRLLEEGALRKKKIAELETALDANYVPYIAQDAKEAAQQLADFMNGNGAGKLLVRNAYAIAKNLDGNFNEAMVEVIDELVTMYSIDQMDASLREDTVQLWQSESKAVAQIVAYIQGLNEAEDAKEGISEQAKLNAYKGYIPNHGDKKTRVIIDEDANENLLEKRGYIKLGAYTGDVNNYIPRSYYVTTTRQSGEYSQGIMQNVNSTYRGVDINTGLTVTGETHNFISGDGVVDQMMGDLADPSYKLTDPKETLLPVFDHDGTVLGFERSINPDVFNQHMKPEQNLAVMLGAWAGRHVEEMLATEYNKTLVDELDRLWQERDTGSEEQFVNLKKTNDPIYKESFNLIPKAIKQYMDDKFDGNGPMVRKDMVNLSVGYREFSVSDLWSGKTRLPDPVRKAVTGIVQTFAGTKAMRLLSAAETATQGVVASAKDIIVIRSLVVPMANMQSNVIQLTTRGVPIKQIVKGFRGKLAEVEQYNQNITKKIELEAALRLNKNNANQKRIIEAKIQNIDDLTSRMSIAPLIAAGAYKNLSEGITDLDVDISKGRLGDVIEGLADKLPSRASDIAKVGLVSKSTKIYQVANRATQYGDFLGKSIYYDHLIAQGLDAETALAKMNEEFVNFSLLPGRSRSALERYGLTWFFAFKIRIAKIAMQQLRENPVRALAINSMLPDIGSPIQDNILSVAVDGKLDYSTGYEMLWAAPELNPWVSLMSD